MGFRCKYEYDAKAVLIASDKQVVLLTYTLESLGHSTTSSSSKKGGSARKMHARQQSEDFFRHQPEIDD